MNSAIIKIDETQNETKKNNDEILLNLFKINKKRYRVLLDLEKLVWEYDGNSNNNDKNEIQICDIIAVKHSIGKNNFVNCLKKNVNNNNNNTNNSRIDDTTEEMNNYKNPKTNLGYQCTEEILNDFNEIENENENDEEFINLKLNLPLSSISTLSSSIKSPLSIIPTTSTTTTKTKTSEIEKESKINKIINNNDDNYDDNDDNDDDDDNNDEKLKNINKNQSIQQLSTLLTSTTTATTTITNEILNNSQYLIINYAKRLKNSKKNYNKWCCKTVIFYNNNTKIIMKWYNLLYKYVNEKLKRPKTILLFINPYGGKKNGIKIYEKICKPLFKLANINVICIISQKSKQIYDIIMEQTLKQYDAICCIGGDGTFSELFNGIIYRTMKDLNINIIKPEYIPKPNIPIGIIPGGSTNTIVYCLHGTCDVITSTIHIILGKKRGLDLASVYNKNGLKKFYASVISYGYLGDIALDSENFRWMGPKRYDYTGIKNFLKNRSYKGDITFLSSEIQINNKNDNIIVHKSNELEKIQKESESESEIKNNTNSSITMTNTTTTAKINNKNNCNTSINNIMEQQQQEQQSNIDNEISTTKCYVNCLKCTNSMASLILPSSLSSTSSSSPTDVSSIEPQLSESINTEKQQQQQQQLLLLSSSTTTTTESTTSTSINQYNNKKLFLNNVKGNFFLISGANISCSCDRSPNGWSQYSHLGDGYLDIILVRHTTFFNNLKLLMAMTKRNGNINNLPFVELYRTKKFLFKAQKNNDENSTTKTSKWNCDGEVIHDIDLTVSSHCQLIDVFMRGPYPEELDDGEKTIKCCGF